ncbi:MAG TPA: intradiol ring-cleavage dioxygenase [Candidatus Cybelea sp.]|nr:intradiol ring-cleavage dioxygenase [Candidatus Cybelea sp.]
MTEQELTDRVLDKVAGAPDLRFRDVMLALVKHLHGFIREVGLTQEEWRRAIDFLTATGQKCDAKRQEFILLSDTLGVSMLVDAVNHRLHQGATESTVLGPFHVAGAPMLPLGADIAEGEPGVPTFVSGRVTDVGGKPIAGAELDVWQTDADGFYDVQRPSLGAMRLRGKFTTDAEGGYRFRTVKPVSYPIPTDGPVGRMLEKLGSHPYRPAHLHMIVSAEGHAPIATHIFVAGDPYIDSDAVFGVKPSLIADFTEHAPGPAPDGTRMDRPFCDIRFDFKLSPIQP